jgi:large repetitive protein
VTVQLTFDDDAPLTGLPDEGQQNKTYDPTPALGHAEVTPEPVGSGPVVEADYSLPLITTPDVTTVEPGGTVTVTGSGLAASSTGTLSLVAADGTVLVEAPVTADATGAIPATSLVVPAEAVDGDYTLTLTGGAVVIDNVTVTVGAAPPVEPEVTPDVTEVAAGGTVTAAGTGFPADTAGTVGLYDTAGTAIVEAPVTTDADGAFSGAALVVPAGTAAGDLALRATVGDATSPDVTVTVTDAPPGPVLAASPTTVDSAGDEAARTVTASGTGFPASAAGRVAINTSDGTEVVGADVTADAAGVLPDTPLIVPAAQAAGDYAVHAEFTGVTVDDVALTVTATPAPTPLAAPANVAAGTPTATDIPLTWDAVANATAYRIETSTDGTTWTPDATEPTTNSGTATGLTAATEYQLRVTALGDGTTYTDSDPSAVVTATTAAALAESASVKRTTTRKKATDG